MDRRIVITTSYLVLALLALTLAGLCSPAGAPASAGVAQLPQPAPVAMGPLAPRGMSGDFAPRLLASAGAADAPFIYNPADTWRGRHGFRWGYHDLGIYAKAPATLSC